MHWHWKEVGTGTSGLGLGARKLVPNDYLIIQIFLVITKFISEKVWICLGTQDVWWRIEYIRVRSEPTCCCELLRDISVGRVADRETGFFFFFWDSINVRLGERCPM